MTLRLEPLEFKNKTSLKLILKKIKDNCKKSKIRLSAISKSPILDIL